MEFDLNPFEYPIGSGDTSMLVMDVTFVGESSTGKTNGSRLPACFGWSGFGALRCGNPGYSPLNRPWVVGRHITITIEDEACNKITLGSGGRICNTLVH